MHGSRLRFLVLVLLTDALVLVIWFVVRSSDTPTAAPGAAATPPERVSPDFAVDPTTAPPVADAAVQRLVPLPPEAEAELRLLVVREGDEAPLAGVSTHLVTAAGEQRALTDASGILRLAVPAGPVEVEVAATSSTRIARARFEGAGDQRIVAPRRGGEVTGYVVDTAGEPVPGASVLLWKDSPGEPVEWNRPKLSTLTDAAGAFSLPNASGAEGDAESIVLAARLGGRASLFELASRTSALAPVHGARLVLADAPLIPGHVRTADGGFMRAYVVARADCGAYLAWCGARPGVRPDGDWLQRDAGCSVYPLNLLLISDATEGFDLPGVPDRWTLTARAEGLPPARLTRDAATDESPIEMVMPAPVTLYGTVRDVSGVPARAARVGIAMPESTNLAVADESGYWQVDKLPAAPVVLTVWAAGRATHIQDLDLADRPPGPLDIVLQPGLTLAGVALDAQGKPLLHAPIQLAAELSDRVPSGPVGEVGDSGRMRRIAHDSRTTGDGGSFRFEDLAAGRYRLEQTAGPEDQVHAAVLAHAGDTNVRLVQGEGLDLIARVTGRVLDAAGQARADVLVHMQAWADADERLLTLQTDRFPDETARFTLPDMPPGWVRLVVWPLPDMRIPAAAWERSRGEPLLTWGPQQVTGGAHELELRLPR